MIGGWGEADPARTERTQPGGRFVSSVRAARSVIHVKSGLEWGASLFPFVLEGFPFPSRIYQCSLSESERICVDLDEFEGG